MLQFLALMTAWSLVIGPPLGPVMVREDTRSGPIADRSANEATAAVAKSLSEATLQLCVSYVADQKPIDELVNRRDVEKQTYWPNSVTWATKYQMKIAGSPEIRFYSDADGSRSCRVDVRMAGSRSAQALPVLESMLDLGLPNATDAHEQRSEHTVGRDLFIEYKCISHQKTALIRIVDPALLDDKYKQFGTEVQSNAVDLAYGGCISASAH